MYLFLQEVPDWQTLGNYGIGIAQLGTLLYFLLRVIPSWKEVRIKEIEARSQDNQTQLEIAKSLGQLSHALTQMSTVTHDIAIEQRKATENTKILQRVNANESLQLSNTVESLIERMDSFEDTLKEQGYETGPKEIKTARS